VTDHGSGGGDPVTHDDLVDALRQVGKEHDDLQTRHTDLAAAVRDLAGVVTKVAGGVGELTDHDVETGRARWRWRTLPPGPARTALWHEISAFVTWYNTRYGHAAQSTAIWACWPQHPVAVEELTALMVAHTAAYAGEDPTDAVIAWHDRWLWPAIERLHSRPGGFKGCTASTHDLRHTVDVPAITPQDLTAAIETDAAAVLELTAPVNQSNALDQTITGQPPLEAEPPAEEDR
jgi:hypothetical protein